MPTPLPAPNAPLAPPPDRDEVVHITQGLKTAMQTANPSGESGAVNAEEPGPDA